MGSLRQVLANLRGKAKTLEITVPKSRKSASRIALPQPTLFSEGPFLGNECSKKTRCFKVLKTSFQVQKVTDIPKVVTSSPKIVTNFPKIVSNVLKIVTDILKIF